MRIALLSIAMLLAHSAMGQTRGDGMSKNTYNVNDPKQTLAFMESFFPCEQVSRLQAHKLILIYTNTNCCIFAFCTWILTTRQLGRQNANAPMVRTRAARVVVSVVLR
jgi:hypothetical protein